MQRRATYRVQLRAEFDFAAAAAQADYLAALGVSHMYCSPYLQAAAGSTHGYDVVDPTRLSEDLGGVAGHRQLVDALREHGLTQLLDVVPNHMSIADRGNAWWWDVLADGLSSPFATFFDIDWEVDERYRQHRILLPVLGDQVGRVLENGDIRLVCENGQVLVAYFDHRFPLSVETVGELLAATGARAHDVVDAIASLEAASDRPSQLRRRTRRHQLLADVAAVLADDDIGRSMAAVLDLRNADLTELDRVLNAQHHRLARWQTAVEEVNYRRFFDINTLVALRVEDPVVFAETMSLVGELVDRGDVDGLRVDHIDGLRRPLRFADRLRELAGSPAWLLAEKILARGEQPPPWALDGSSGYDFLAMVNGLFVDPDGRAPLETLHTDITGSGSDFATAARDGKREVLQTTLVSDVERITSLLATICDAYPAQRDHTHSELTEALVALIAAVPVYRTYVDPSRGSASDVDAGLIRGAAAQAQSDQPSIDGRLLDFMADLFVFGQAEDVATNDSLEIRRAQEDLVLRVQQLCATTTAKGVEDTACYRHLVLTSLNEVGDSPAHFGVSVDEFHDYNRRIQAERPLTLLATSTHDTKRSEDVRCRIDLLSEVPDEWAAAVHRWRAMNATHRREPWPDAAMEYLLYQTLVGAAPLDVDRATAYMEKAAREAKLHTGWLQPNREYEEVLQQFVVDVLEDQRFTADLLGFVASLQPWDRVNSLATTVLKLTSPGVPDIYQGTELWDHSLVDPDNRRPVDYVARRRLLSSGAAGAAAAAWAEDAEGGAPKLQLIRVALGLRRRRPEAFDHRGAYAPGRAQGAFADDVIAFTRGDPAAVLTIAPRRTLRRRGTWRDTMIPLPIGTWRNLCDDAGHGGTVGMDALLSRFPVALLERVG